MTRRRLELAAASLGLVALAALALLWTQRRTIASDVIDRRLRAYGVAATYRVVAIGPGVERIADLRIGDPRDPDLIASDAEVTLRWRLGVPGIARIAATGVRLRARIVGGKLSLGSIDRLLPAPSNAPFALPDLAVDLSDARVRLETPAGVLGVAIDGAGNLADGFSGQVAAIAPRLAAGGCEIVAPTAFVAMRITDRAPHLTGPLRFARVACPASGAAAGNGSVALDAVLNERLDRWRGEARFDVAAMRIASAAAARTTGRVDYAGDAAATVGRVDATLAGLRAGGAHVATTRTTLDYALAAGRRSGSARGRIVVEHATIAGAGARLSGMLPGTPVAPIVDALGRAATAAGRDLSGTADVALVQRPAGGGLRITALDLASARGARLRFGGGGGTTGYWPLGLLRVDGDLTLAGGGMPRVTAHVAQARVDAPRQGVVTVAPYAAGSARIALDPVRIDGGRATTRLRLDGPLGDGAVRGLDLPVALRIGAGGSFALEGGCRVVGFAALRIVGAQLGPTRLGLCATGPALLARDAGGRLSGGGRIAAPRMTGRIGETALIVAARELRVLAAPPGFAVAALDVRLGPATRLVLDRLEGAFDGGGYAGAAGRLANVPLLLSAGQGRWRLRDGVLSLDGRARIADSAAPARFAPLDATGIDLSLKGGAIALKAGLAAPASGRQVARLTLVHDLSAGRGSALLDVAGLVFDDGLQPEALTPLTLGVVANVRGKVTGRGHIRWSPDGVTSDGDFATDGTSLAAAFGNVEGIKGTIHFDDLLALTTPAGQAVTLGTVNPGIEVTGGTVRYRLLPDQRVAVEEGRWPFAGGMLILEPTVLDFGRPSARAFTFRVEGLDAARFIQQLDLANVSATGLFDGVLPIVFDDKGGRIVAGRLVARRGGGKLAYVGELSQADIGSAGKLAFDALKSMRYNALTIALDGALDGEIVSQVAFAGVNEAPLSLGGSRLLPGMTNLPFKFNIRVAAPFRGLMNTARSFADVTQTVHQALPQTAPAPVQPADSAPRR